MIKPFPLKSGIRQEIPKLPLYFNTEGDSAKGNKKKSFKYCKRSKIFIC